MKVSNYPIQIQYPVLLRSHGGWWSCICAAAAAQLQLRGCHVQDSFFVMTVIEPLDAQNRTLSVQRYWPQPLDSAVTCCHMLCWVKLMSYFVHTRGVNNFVTKNHLCCSSVVNRGNAKFGLLNLSTNPGDRIPHVLSPGPTPHHHFEQALVGRHGCRCDCE